MLRYARIAALVMANLWVIAAFIDYALALDHRSATDAVWVLIDLLGALVVLVAWIVIFLLQREEADREPREIGDYPR